jgi:hypothetical protein
VFFFAQADQIRFIRSVPIMRHTAKPIEKPKNCGGTLVGTSVAR